MLRVQWEALVLGKPERFEKGNAQAAKTQTEPHWLAGLGHEYTTVEFDPQLSPEPQSNGDLHTLYVPVHWWKQREQQTNRVSVAPAISVSSNALKNPDEMSSDSMQLWLALEHRRQASTSFQWLLGLCADHRFGSYKGYPIAGLLWQPSERWSVRLAFPDSNVSYKITQAWFLSVSASPDGNEWHVLDSELQRRSKYIREAWHLEGRLSWQFHPAWTLSVAVGRAFEQELQFSLEDNRVEKTELDDASSVAVELRWIFLEDP